LITNGSTYVQKTAIQVKILKNHVEVGRNIIIHRRKQTMHK